MRTSLLIYVSLVVLMFVAPGCYEVVYTVEHKGDSCTKFENAMYEIDTDVWVEACLGEDGAVEADAFYVELEGEPDPENINVTIKAGKCKTPVTLEPAVITIDEVDYNVLKGEACGFEIFGMPVPGIDVWLFGVISDDVEGGKDGTAALSNITICFCEDATVIGPEEGDFLTPRAEGDEEIEEAIKEILEELYD